MLRRPTADRSADRQNGPCVCRRCSLAASTHGRTARFPRHQASRPEPERRGRFRRERTQIRVPIIRSTFCRGGDQDPCPRVSVTRVVSVMDIGRVLNAKTCRSQVMGGVVMGIGQALMEETIYDSRTARPVDGQSRRLCGLCERGHRHQSRRVSSMSRTCISMRWDAGRRRDWNYRHGGGDRQCGVSCDGNTDSQFAHHTG